MGPLPGDVILRLGGIRALGVLGLIHPLKWLPIFVFMLFYKSLWLIIVAYPLWRAGTAAGSPAEAMTNAFLGLPVAMLAMPWKYFFENFVFARKSRVT